MFPACCFLQRTCIIGYSMRHELILVSSINDSCLVRLVYIGGAIPLSWGVFTLLYFTHLLYLICLYLSLCVCWRWTGFGFHIRLFCVCRRVSQGLCGFFKFTGSPFSFLLYMYTYVCLCVCVCVCVCRDFFSFLCEHV